MSQAVSSSQDIAALVIHAASEKKAQDPVILDLRSLTNVADFFIICSGRSSRTVQAIVDEVESTLEAHHVSIHHIEGYREALWVLIDCGDVITHVFYPATRDFYDLERLWGDAPRVPFKPSDTPPDVPAHPSSPTMPHS